MFISRYQNPNGVQCKYKFEDCDTLIYGSLTKALTNAGLLPIMDSQSDNSCIKNSGYTLNQLIVRLTGAKFPTYPTHAGYNHSQCHPLAEWLEKVPSAREFTCEVSLGAVMVKKTPA